MLEKAEIRGDRVEAATLTGDEIVHGFSEAFYQTFSGEDFVFVQYCAEEGDTVFHVADASFVRMKGEADAGKEFANFRYDVFHEMFNFFFR